MTTFTDEEYEDFFGSDAEELAPRGHRLPGWARSVGIFIAIVMSAGGVASLVNEILTRPTIREPIDIEAEAWARVEASPLGWLVDDLVIVDIDAPRVGAFVTNNPPDGVIRIDRRPWTASRLAELMDHEIGHLLDFAVWGRASEGRRNGLASEAWAECAAVAAGTRRTDAVDPGGEYHCFDEEFVLFEEAMAELTEVCKTWGDRECRNLDE